MNLSTEVIETIEEDCTSLLKPPFTNGNIEYEGRRRIKTSQRAAYGAGHVMNDICAAMWFSYTLLFFQVVLGMPPLLAGAMLLIGQVADAVATPIVGILADRFGSRKKWHLFGTALTLVSFPLIFSPCPGCQNVTPAPVPVLPEINSTLAQEEESEWTRLTSQEIWLRATYYSFLIIIFQAGWAIVQIAHLALIPDLTPTQHERNELTAIRYTASVCSSVLMYLVTWLVLHITTGSDESVGPGDAYKFRDIVLIGLALGAIFTIWFQWIVVAPRTVSQIKGSKNLNVLKNQEVRLYLRSPILYKVSILYVSSRLLLTLSLVYMPLYLVESLGEQAESLATVPLVSYLASFLAAMAVKQSSSFAESKLVYLIGAVVSIAGCIWVRAGVGSTYKHVGVYGIAVLLGAGSSITMVASLCLTADLIGANTDSGAFVYSLVTFADKLLNGVAVILIENFQCGSYWLCPHYYRDVLAYVCGGSTLLGILALISLYSDHVGELTYVPEKRSKQQRETIR